MAQAYRPLPAGCDQQGRFDTRPLAAEAATELGADDMLPPRVATSARRVTFYSAFVPVSMSLTAVGLAALAAWLWPQ